MGDRRSQRDMRPARRGPSVVGKARVDSPLPELRAVTVERALAVVLREAAMDGDDDAVALREGLRPALAAEFVGRGCPSP